MTEVTQEGDLGEENITFFSDVSMQEFAFGVGAVGVNGLCLGMMLNIPTLTLHNLMYKVAPKGILQPETTDQERFHVAKAIIDYWYKRTQGLSPKKRFNQLYVAFKWLKEKVIAEELKKRFEANQPISLEMFHTFDLGRLGPYVPPAAEDLIGEGRVGEDDEEDDEFQNFDDDDE